MVPVGYRNNQKFQILSTALEYLWHSSQAFICLWIFHMRSKFSLWILTHLWVKNKPTFHSVVSSFNMWSYQLHLLKNLSRTFFFWTLKKLSSTFLFLSHNFRPYLLCINLIKLLYIITLWSTLLWTKCMSMLIRDTIFDGLLYQKKSEMEGSIWANKRV